MPSRDELKELWGFDEETLDDIFNSKELRNDYFKR